MDYLCKNLQTSNNQVSQIQVYMTFHCVDLEKHFTKKRMSHLHRYCLSQKLLQEKIHEKAEEKERHQGLLVSTPVRDEIVVNKTNRQTKIKKTKKARKSLFCKVSSDSESEVELVVESDTCI